MTNERRTVHLDPRNLRGLAHPLRLKLLGELRKEGPATATTLAKRLGESSGATSYHLRQLAEYGFVEEDVERGVGRERWWRAMHESTRLDVQPLLQPAQTRDALERLLYEVANIHAQTVTAAIGGLWSQPPEWIDAMMMSDLQLKLTAEEAQELAKELGAVAERWRRPADATQPEDGRWVRVHLHVFPEPESDR